MKTTLFKHRRQDRIAREIAASHNMLDDYTTARRNGCSSIEALEDWDLLDEEAINKLNQYDSNRKNDRPHRLQHDDQCRNEAIS